MNDAPSSSSSGDLHAGSRSSTFRGLVAQMEVTPGASRTELSALQALFSSEFPSAAGSEGISIVYVSSAFMTASIFEQWERSALSAQPPKPRTPRMYNSITWRECSFTTDDGLPCVRPRACTVVSGSSGPVVHFWTTPIGTDEKSYAVVANNGAQIDAHARSFGLHSKAFSSAHGRVTSTPVC